MLMTRQAAIFALIFALGACETTAPSPLSGTVTPPPSSPVVTEAQPNNGGGREVPKVSAARTPSLLGALIEAPIGTSLESADRMRADQAASRAYAGAIGEPVSWSNPLNGTSGTITTTREGYSPSGAYCREFKQTIVVKGRSERGMGTACQQPDGTWKIMQ